MWQPARGPSLIPKWAETLNDLALLQFSCAFIPLLLPFFWPHVRVSFKNRISYSRMFGHANELLPIVVKATLYVLILVYASSEILKKLPKHTPEILKQLQLFQDRMKFLDTWRKKVKLHILFFFFCCFFFFPFKKLATLSSKSYLR